MLWISPLLLTLQLMALSVLVAASIGIPLAWLIDHLPQHRRSYRCIAQYCLLSLVVCVATPMILHAAAWEATAGKFGWLTFTQTSARTYTGLAGRYGGLVACVWIHGLIGAALVALATRFGTARVDRAVLDQACLDGGPEWIWWRIRLPIAAPWVISGLVATALLAATEMTVVDLYGVRTLADEFYLYYAAQPSIESILVVLVVPCALMIALIGSLMLARQRLADTPLLELARRSSQPQSTMLRQGGLACAAAALALSTLMYAFPLAGLLLKTGQQIVVTDTATGDASMQWSIAETIKVLAAAPREFSREYLWTALLAGCVVTVCVPAAWMIASIAAARPTIRQSVDLVSLILFLIPGPIVGLMVVRFFTLPLPGFHTAYHATLMPTVVALLARAMPVSYWVMRTGYAGIDSAVRDASTIDLSWAARMWWVDRPLLRRTLVVTAFAAAITASGDVPATLPVVPPGVVTVGTRLFALLHSGARNQESALAFWYVGSIVLATVALSLRWKRTG